MPISDLRDGGGDVDPVLPLKLSPHAAELQNRVISKTLQKGTKTYLSFCAVGGLDVVHDINVNIIQDNTLFRHPRSFPQDGTEDDTSLCRRDLRQIGQSDSSPTGSTKRVGLP